MFILVLFLFVTNSAIQGTQTYEVCKAEGFKHPGCDNAKKLDNTNKFLLSIQGK